MDYREYPPTPLLVPYVDRLWTLAGTADELGGASEPVLPDGRPELVVHFGDAFERITLDGVAERQAHVIMAGQLSAQLLLRPLGRIAVLGVRFQPFGAAAFVRVPQHELTGGTPALSDVDASLARQLEAVRQVTDSPETAVPLVCALLEDVLSEDRLDRRVQAVSAAITRSTGVTSIDRLARHVGWSRRQLERKFLDAVGIPPKRLARIVRFQAALSAMTQEPSGMRGAATAAAFGYADQSHFIRDFRELAGCPPGGHLIRDAVLTGFFITDSLGSPPRR